MPNIKTVKKTVHVDEQGGIPLESFSFFIDTTKVYKYQFKKNKDGTLTLKFYDKKGKLVKPYGQL